METGARGGDELLAGNTAPLSTLTEDCASRSQEVVFFHLGSAYVCPVAQEVACTEQQERQGTPAQPTNPGDPGGH